MATVASGGGIVTSIKPCTHKLNPPFSPFLGQKLNYKSSPRTRNSNLSNSKAFAVVAAAGGGELIDAVHNLFLGVGVGLPCTVMECGDMIYRSTLPKQTGLNATAPGVGLALAALSYLWATPGVAPGFFDMFFLAFVERLFRPTFRKDDFVLGKKLGEGAFGVVYKASLSKKASSKTELLLAETSGMTWPGHIIP